MAWGAIDNRGVPWKRGLIRMRLGDKIRKLREMNSLTQGQLAHDSSVSQGYLSQLENGDVKNPSVSVLLRIAQAVHVEADELFEAAGYPTVRTLRRKYQDYEATVNPDLLDYLSRLPRERQRRILGLLEQMEKAVKAGEAVTWRHGHGREGVSSAFELARGRN